MKSRLLQACALSTICALSWTTSSHAQAGDDILRRLEAKIDALSKENASLRDRVKRIETTRPAPIHVASLNSSVSDASPARSTETLRPVQRVAPVKAIAPARASCTNFGGLYGGIHGGSVTNMWQANDRNSWAKNDTDLGLPSDVSGTANGYHVGVQGGWNWQPNCTLLGVEADWSWSGLKQTKHNTDGQPGANLDQLETSADLRWWGTVRARSGVVVDNLLLFLTGGLAYANIRYSSTVIDQGVPVPVETLSATQTRFGWTAGLGAEYAWSETISLKGEVLYVNFFDENKTYISNKAISNGSPGNKTFDYSDSLLASRISLVYRWR